MDIPDLLYLNRFGWELPEYFQGGWSDLYTRANDSEGEQHLTLEYDNLVNRSILNVKESGSYIEYVPLEKLEPCNYKPLTVYMFSDDDTYTYGRFNQYIKDHKSELGISIEKDRKLAAEAARYAKFKTFDTWTKKTDKPIEPDYWYQYWGGFAEGYLSTNKDLK